MSVPEPPSIDTTGPTTIWEYADFQAQQAKTLQCLRKCVRGRSAHVSEMRNEAGDGST